ncbi:MAG: family 2 glycosyl transferase [Parcubacteria group bacterium LiPW_39]|nr:MAG: family 2 glycosyl transferase [Parcubacteria group bacterium LiPW_39]
MPEQNFSLPAGNQAPTPASFPQKDLWVAAAVGFLCALLIIPIFKNLAPQISFKYSLGLLIILPILSVLGMWVAGRLAKLIAVIYQLAKFILVGALNTFVDWGVLNLLIFLTTIASGWFYSGFKGISFMVAVVNSYFWNKFWTFNKTRMDADINKPRINADDADNGTRKSAPKEFLQFFVVSCIGFALNVGVATLIVNVWGPQWGLAEKVWANIGALGGTLIGLTWNFLGYKLIVFKG